MTVQSKLLIELLEFIQRQRVAEQIALIGLAAYCGEKVALLLGFDALGNHRQAQTPSQGDDHFCDGGIVGIDENVLDE